MAAFVDHPDILFVVLILVFVAAVVFGALIPRRPRADRRGTRPVDAVHRHVDRSVARAADRRAIAAAGQLARRVRRADALRRDMRGDGVSARAGDMA